MNAQTDRRTWLTWLVAVSGVIFIGFAITLIRPWGFYWSRLAPWNNAHLVYTMAAIDAFSANIPHHYPLLSERLGALAGIVILFVIGPSLWIFAEVSKKEQAGSGKAAGNVIINLGWYAGVMIVMAGLWYGMSSSVRNFRYDRTSTKISAYFRNKNRLSYNLMTEAFKAVDAYYLPRSEGGAGESFKTIAIRDLIPHRQYSDDVYMTGSVTSDSVITFYAVGNVDGRDPGFKNANGQTGKIQMALKVHPTGNKLVTWLKDNRDVN